MTRREFLCRYSFVLGQGFKHSESTLELATLDPKMAKFYIGGLVFVWN